MSEGLKGLVSGVGKDTPTHVIVAGAIRRQIALGRLRPGDALPSERDLSQQLGVGRTTLRQAIKILVTEGWVDTRLGRGGGTVILEDKLGSPKDLSHMAELYAITVEQTYEFRLALEPVVARMAASRATGDEILALREILEEPAQTVHAYHALDSRFHTKVAEASGNPLMLDAVENSRAGFFPWANVLWLNADWRGIRVRRKEPEHGDVGRAFKADHYPIVAAIADKDPEKAHISMEDHLKDTRDLFGELLESIFVTR